MLCYRSDSPQINEILTFVYMLSHEMQKNLKRKILGNKKVNKMSRLSGGLALHQVSC